MIKKKRRTAAREALKSTLKTNIEQKEKIPANVKCNCGHTAKHHYKGGWCHSGDHPQAGQCGCTWFYPNDKYILRKNKLKNNEGTKS